MRMIIGPIVLFVFVASLFKKNPNSGNPDYDRRLTSDVGAGSSQHDFGSWNSDSGSDSCDSGDGGDRGCESGRRNDE